MTVRSSKTTPTTIHVTPADEPILRLVLRFFCLTAEQVRRALYGRGSLKYAYARLKRLVDGGLLVHHQTPGNPGVYWLSGRGRGYLEGLGLDVPSRFRLVELREHTSLFYRHMIGLNDVLLAAEILCRRQRRIRLQGMRHDLDLRRRPVEVVLGRGQRRRVVPDGFLNLVVAEAEGAWRYPVVVELDRGTHERRSFQDKVECLLAYARGPGLSALGVKSLTIAVVATPGDARRAQLQAWTEAVLTRLGCGQEADLFRFTGADAATVPPADWFLGPVWHVPFAARPEPLLVLDPLLAGSPEDAARPYELVNFHAPPATVVRSIPSHFMSEEAMARFLAAVDDDEPLDRREPYRSDVG